MAPETELKMELGLSGVDTESSDWDVHSLCFHKGMKKISATRGVR